jgi:hypothetical protein
MNELIQGTNAQSGPLVPFCFGEHPFYDWAELTKNTFGLYQGGPYSRYSCGGTDPASIFGSKLEGDDKWRASGKQKLEEVIGILCELVCWVDSLKDTENVPIQEMCKNVSNVVARTWIGYAAVSLDTSEWESSLTIVSGSGMLESGRHLRRLVFPVAGTASYNQLKKTNIDYLLIDQMKALEIFVNDPEESYQTEEQVVEIEFLKRWCGWFVAINDRPVHLRDKMETILCESHPCRDLGKKEMHVNDGHTFEITNEGVLMVKGYNRSGWEIIPPGDKSLRFLNEDSLLLLNEFNLKTNR